MWYLVFLQFHTWLGISRIVRDRTWTDANLVLAVTTFEHD
jgi:hypothetical protein